MTFIPSTSRRVNTNPGTPAALQTTLALLDRNLGVDRTDIDDHEERLDDIESVFEQTAIADESLALGDVLRKAAVAGHVAKADASAIATADVCGVAKEPANSGGSVRYAPFGLVEITGATLTEGGDYFLSAVTSGALVAAPDTETEGAVAIVVGTAQSATALFVNVGQPLVY